MDRVFTRIVDDQVHAVIMTGSPRKPRTRFFTGYALRKLAHLHAPKLPRPGMTSTLQEMCGIIFDFARYDG